MPQSRCAPYRYIRTFLYRIWRLPVAEIESRLNALGLVLPPPLTLPWLSAYLFEFVRINGSRALISGHGPQNADGSIARPLGKLGGNFPLSRGITLHS